MFTHKYDHLIGDNIATGCAHETHILDEWPFLPLMLVTLLDSLEYNNKNIVVYEYCSCSCLVIGNFLAVPATL